MRTWIGLLLLALVFAPPLRAQEEEGETAKSGVGAGARVGLAYSWGQGYREISASAGTSLQLGGSSPFLNVELSSNTYTRQASAGLGLWTDLDGGRSFKAEAGAAAGELQGSSQRTVSFYLEGGLEQSLGEASVGADYRLATGSLALSRRARATSLKSIAKGKAGSSLLSDLKSGVSHELGVYGSVPLGFVTGDARLTLDRPSGGDSTTSEEFGLTLPLAGPLSLNGSVTFSQGGAGDTLYSLGAGLHF